MYTLTLLYVVSLICTTRTTKFKRTTIKSKKTVCNGVIVNHTVCEDEQTVDIDSDDDSVNIVNPDQPDVNTFNEQESANNQSNISGRQIIGKILGRDNRKNTVSDSELNNDNQNSDKGDSVKGKHKSKSVRTNISKGKDYVKPKKEKGVIQNGTIVYGDFNFGNVTTNRIIYE